MSASPRHAKRFVSFIGVGGAGFLVDAVILSTLVHAFDWAHYSARAASFSVAVVITWLANRTWVFERTRNLVREFGTYVSAQIGGVVLNLGTYSLAIALAPDLAHLPVIPLAMGSAVAAVFNYSAANKWVFTK